MNDLVMQIVDDDGDVVLEPKWHMHTVLCGDEAMLCTGNFTDSGGSSGNGEEYKFKSVKRGGITCDDCLSMIMELKRVKL